MRMLRRHSTRPSSPPRVDRGPCLRTSRSPSARCRLPTEQHQLRARGVSNVVRPRVASALTVPLTCVGEGEDDRGKRDHLQECGHRSEARVGPDVFLEPLRSLGRRPSLELEVLKRPPLVEGGRKKTRVYVCHVLSHVRQCLGPGPGVERT